MAKETSDFNVTPSSERVHISFFGKRNAGKSSLVNAITSQKLSIVSDIKGTTTDPVRKSMELLPLGPVVIIDTPGTDDEGMIGELRIEKAKQVLNETDIAVLVTDEWTLPHGENALLTDMFRDRKIPFIVVYNKADLNSSAFPDFVPDFEYVTVSTVSGQGTEELKEKLAHLVKPLQTKNKKIAGDLVSSGDVVVLVTPIDSSAPKGRMILPQVQTIRDLLDVNACPLVTQVPQLDKCLAELKNKPSLVITDSQAFKEVSRIVPDDIPLTSFSILFARYKGILDTAVSGARAVKNLKDGDKVLISEGCTHHRQCEDIGTVKLPAWIESFCGCRPEFSFTSGREFPDDLSSCKAVIHCGGCMLNEREVISRMERCKSQNIPFTNYGILIAYINGILDRSIAPLK